MGNPRPAVDIDRELLKAGWSSRFPRRDFAAVVKAVHTETYPHGFSFRDMLLEPGVAIHFCNHVRERAGVLPSLPNAVIMEIVQWGQIWEGLLQAADLDADDDDERQADWWKTEGGI